MYDRLPVKAAPAQNLGLKARIDDWPDILPEIRVGGGSRFSSVLPSLPIFARLELNSVPTSMPKLVNAAIVAMSAFASFSSRVNLAGL